MSRFWAPVLRPSDATDPRFGELIANGEQFNIHSLRLRDAQEYGPGFLVDRWSQIEKNPGKRDRVTRQTAINAVCRRPLEIVDLAVKTYMGYCGVAAIQSCANKDLGYSKLTDDQVKMLAEKFGFVTEKQLPSQPISLLQQYYLGAWPYYFLVLVSPLICALAALVGRHRAFSCLLFVHASILMVVVTALSARACIRYLQPVSILTLLSIAICADIFIRRTAVPPTQPLIDANELRQPT